MKILIAINEDKGIDSKLSEHFGHCPYFGIYETETGKAEVVESVLDHSDSNSTPVDQIMQFNPDIVFTLGVGQRAIGLFNDKAVKLRTGDFKVVREVIDNLDNLEEVGDGCGH